MLWRRSFGFKDFFVGWYSIEIEWSSKGGVRFEVVLIIGMNDGLIVSYIDWK